MARRRPFRSAGVLPVFKFVVLTLIVVSPSSGYFAEIDVEEWGRLLKSEDLEVRRDAARDLSAMGSAARPAAVYLTLALDDEDRLVRYHAAEALGKMGPAVGDVAGPRLARMVRHDPSGAVARQAALALQLIDYKPPRLRVPWLAGDFPKGSSVEGIIVSGTADTDASPPRGEVERLIVKLADDDPRARLNAAAALGKLRGRAASAVPALIRRSRDKHKMVRFYVAEALGRIETLGSKRGIDALQVLSHDPAWLVRRKGRQSLGEIRARIAADEARIRAAEARQESGPARDYPDYFYSGYEFGSTADPSQSPAPPPLPVPFESRESESPLSAANVASLLRFVRTGTPQRRESALTILAARRLPPLSEAQIGLLQDDHARKGDPRILRILTRTLARQPRGGMSEWLDRLRGLDYDDRKAALRALGESYYPGRAAPYLVPLALSDEPAIRDPALDALRHGGPDGERAAALVYALARGLSSQHVASLIERAGRHDAFTPQLLPVAYGLGEGRVRDAVLRVTARTRGSLLPSGDQMRELWKEADPPLRADAAQALLRLDRLDRVLNLWLLPYLAAGDRKELARVVAGLHAAARSRRDPAAAYARLLQAEEDEDRRSEIVVALSYHLRQARLVVPILLKTLENDPSASVRETAIRRVVRLDPDPDEALPPLIGALAAETTLQRRILIARAMQEIAGEEHPWRERIVRVHHRLLIEQAARSLREIVETQERLTNETDRVHKQNLLQLLGKAEKR